MSRSLALLLFCPLLLGLVSWAQRHTPPPPFYDALIQDAEVPLIHLDAHHDFVFEFVAPAASIRGIWLRHLFTDPEAEVLVQVENRTQTQLLLREHVGQGHRHWARLPPTNRKGDRIAVTYRILRSRQEQFPAIVQAIKRSAHPPRYPVTILSGGDPPSGEHNAAPLFQLRFHHPLRFLLFLWPFVLVGGFILYRRDAPQSGRLAFLLLLSLAAAATSYLTWTQGYETDPGRFDPDQHLAYAKALDRWLDSPDDDTRSHLADWFAQNPRAHVPLVPALAALLSQAGLPVIVSYLWIAGVASFAVLLLLDYFLVVLLQVKPRSSALVLALFGTQIVFTIGFLHPSPDSTLTALALAGCVALTLRAHRSFPWQSELVFGLGLLAMALCHPPGMASALFFVVLAILLDLLRRRRLKLREQGRALEFYFLPPAVIFALLALGFNWPHSMAAFRNGAIANQHLSTWRCWLPPFLVSLQALLLACPGLRLRDSRRIALLVPALWMVLFLVETSRSLEPFQLRSFLPVLPAIHLVAAAGIQRLETQRPHLLLALTLLLAGVNLWGSLFLLEQSTPLDPFVSRFLTW